MAGASRFFDIEPLKVTVTRDTLSKVTAEAVMIGVTQDDAKALQAELAGCALASLVRDLVKRKEFSGKWKELMPSLTHGKLGARWAILVGLGKAEGLTLDRVREASALAARQARSLGLNSLATHVLGARVLGDAPAAAQAIVEGATLGLYRFDQYKTADNGSTGTLSRLIISVEDSAAARAIRKTVKQGTIVAEGTEFARNLANTPANYHTPSDLAAAARELAKRYGVDCQVLSKSQIERLGMGALLAVSQGSHQPPKFIVMQHNKAKKNLDTMVFVGKGITFDSGGISIKPSKNMDHMKYDMSGAAAVMGTMMVAARLEWPVHLVGLVPTSENLPGGGAIKPGDVVTSLSGQTIEILNTDAEGRLVLADGLAYAERFKPALTIDLATLTGACVVALGDQASGVMGTNELLVNRLMKAGQFCGERVWPFPLWSAYQDAMKSSVADLQNISSMDGGGTITAGAFLSRFAKGPWAHLDIAPTAWSTSGRPECTKGATGVGVRLLAQFVEDWIASPGLEGDSKKPRSTKRKQTRRKK